MQYDMTALNELLEPVVESLGYELLLIENTHNQQEAVLRLYIDAPGGILVDDCARVSRQVSLLLDVEDPVQGKYVLEVSSPGIDRPLAKPDHFERVLGQQVRVKTHDYVLGRRNFRGELLQVDGQQVVVEADGEAYDIELANIELARLVPDYDV